MGKEGTDEVAAPGTQQDTSESKGSWDCEAGWAQVTGKLVLGYRGNMGLGARSPTGRDGSPHVL